VKGFDPLQEIARAIAFGRHVPLSRIARRIELDLKRRVKQRGAKPAPAAAPSLSARPPAPLFAPRLGKLDFRDGRPRLSFVGRSCEMEGPLDWRAGGEGPANQLWRMNLHYMEYLEEADDRLFAELVRQWIDANPPYARGYWKDSWNSYTVSLRTVVWMQQFASRGARLDAATREAAVASLAQQIRFLEANLETDIGGNHLIKNIKALLLASAFFAGSEAERWRALGLQLLAEEIAGQVLRDGTHYERSPSYHCQVFADLLECRQALGDDPLDGALDDALARMAQAAVDLAHPDGYVALFNDAGLSMAYPPRECLDAYARLYGKSPARRRTFALKDAGYFGLRSDGTYLVVDCGRIAPDELPAHGHGDVASFELSVAGQRIFVDQGVYEYYTGERRQCSRSAASHNTLCFDGADQADFFGSFRCGRRPNVEVLEHQVRDDGFSLTAAHDGFRNLSGSPRHIRRFDATADRIEVEDRIDGTTDRPASIGFLLHPAVVAEVSGHDARLRLGPLDIILSSSRPIGVEAAVWWPDMGVERRTQRLRIGFPPDAKTVTTAIRLPHATDGFGQNT
jgi:uncharacterized heparinase superfamily protein